MITRVFLPCTAHMSPAIFLCIRSNTDVEAEIGQLRAQLLHKDQENERVQLQLQEEKEERERAQRKVQPCLRIDCMTMHSKLLTDQTDTDYDMQYFCVMSCKLRLCITHTH